MKSIFNKFKFINKKILFCLILFSLSYILTNSKYNTFACNVSNSNKEQKQEISVKEEYRKEDFDIFKEKVLIPSDKRRNDFLKIAIVNWILDDSTTLEEIKKDISNRLIGKKSIFVPLDMYRNSLAQNFFTYPPKH
ncbi:hypothetical protein [Candidatus Phytoplasma asteris]|uniref:Secreted protein n=2 Tax=16SrI (Aster yellows group) TaxID=3042590 RepID=A0ABZ3CCJ0_9MOLU|nr:MAG: putative secreted protein [Rapeseed phyllody phytoplasma]